MQPLVAKEVHFNKSLTTSKGKRKSEIKKEREKEKGAFPEMDSNRSLKTCAACGQTFNLEM